MRSKLFSFFKRTSRPMKATPSKIWFETQLKNRGLDKKFQIDELSETQSSVRVFANKKYLPDTETINEALTKVTAVNVSGDKSGFFQNGLPFPDETGYFEKIPVGHPELLSPIERLAGSKKVVSSHSLVTASGGYPFTNPLLPYRKPIKVSIFSLAGPSFENNYLHYRLFLLDPVQKIIDSSLFSHLYDGLPILFDEAKKELGEYDTNKMIARIRLGFPYLARFSSGGFYPSFSKTNAIIFLSEAYFRYQLEDISLLLASVNQTAKETGKKAFLKATAVGMGFFAKIDCGYDIKHMIFPYYLRAYKKLLSEHKFPWIAKIEFPIFNEIQQEQFDSIFEDYNGLTKVYQSTRDVLQFREEEIEKYLPAVINPSDAFALTGNEWGYASVESMIGNNSSIRFDQVHHMNPLILDPSHHVEAQINKDHSVELSIKSTPRALSSIKF
ncbi:TPA: type IV secretion protein Dot [Legionella pneumophila]|nr:type IV secretion protein Dot [Legionella pneumophila]